MGVFHRIGLRCKRRENDEVKARRDDIQQEKRE